VSTTTTIINPPLHPFTWNDVVTVSPSRVNKNLLSIQNLSCPEFFLLIKGFQQESLSSSLRGFFISWNARKSQQLLKSMKKKERGREKKREKERAGVVVMDTSGKKSGEDASRNHGS